MKCSPRTTSQGFTLIELLTALIILSLLALMSYRGLGSVLDARDYTKQETEKWQRVTAFLTRFERDVRLAARRPARIPSGIAPAWHGKLHALPEGGTAPYLEFNRFAPYESADAARRVAYRLNQNQEIELWLWPGLDIPPGLEAVRYPVLTGVTKFELHYLNTNGSWITVWPEVAAGSTTAAVSSLPKAVRLSLVLASGEEIDRIFH
jgi:general secretion pathway protein J